MSMNPTSNSACGELEPTALMTTSWRRTLNNFVENYELRDTRSHGPVT